MRGFGGMISFALAGGEAAALDGLRRDAELFPLAESLGGVESLIEHPGADDPRLGGGHASSRCPTTRAALGRASRTSTTCRRPAQALDRATA